MGIACLRSFKSNKLYTSGLIVDFILNSVIELSYDFTSGIFFLLFNDENSNQDKKQELLIIFLEYFKIKKNE